MDQSKKAGRKDALGKAPTGIKGLDEVTNGVLPKGRPTLIVGGAGSGKTLMAMEFLAHGAEDYDEPGVFMVFEETRDELSENVQSLGFDLPKLIEQKKALRGLCLHRTGRGTGIRGVQPRRSLQEARPRDRLH